MNKRHAEENTNCIHCSHKKLLWIRSSASIIAFIIGLSTLSISLTKPDNPEPLNMNVEKQDQEICIDCFNLFLLSRNKVTLSEHYLKSQIPCCEYNFTYATGTIKTIVKNANYDVKVRRMLKKTVPVSVHKYLLPSNQAMNFSNVDHVTVALDIESRANNSNNHKRGVKIHHDGIEVLYSGLYYVYSSLYYEPKTKVSSENFPYQTWFHYVYRTRPCSPAMSSVILRTVFTCCPSCAHSKDSVYTGGIFHLKAGDIIQVCLSGQGIMGKDTVKDSSFLGLYMLTSG